MPSKDQNYAKAVTWDWEVLEAYDNTQNLVLCITPRQAQALLTVVAQQMLWSTRWANYSDFQTIQEFVADIGSNLMSCEEFCAALVNCINDDEDVRNALREAGANSGGDGVNGSDLRAGDGEGNILEGLPCDNDTISGVVTDLVDYIHTQIVDGLEIIESYTSDVEQKAAFLSGVPALGTVFSAIGIDLIPYFDEVLDNSLQEYNAGYTAQVRDKYRKALFEIACPACELTLNDISQFFAKDIGKSFVAGQIIGEIFLDLLGLGGYSGASYCSFMSASMVAAWQANATFFGTSAYSMNLIAKMSDPNDDWDILGWDCGNYQQQMLLDEGSDYGWIIDDARTEYDPARGFVATGSPLDEAIFIHRTFSFQANVTEFRMTPISDAGTIRVILYFDDVIKFNSTIPDSGETTIWTGDEDVTTIKIESWVDANDDYVLQVMYQAGSGDNPYT